MKEIPIKAAKAIAEKYEYSQVVIIARAVGDNGGEHVTTYGVDKANCDVAARLGYFFKHKAMQWPTGIACDGCDLMVQEDWKYCPYCGAQERKAIDDET